MTYSANEVEALGTRAARGAGAPPAQAARFGRALVVHLAQARPVCEVLAALDVLPGGPILTHALEPDETALGQSYREASHPQRLAHTRRIPLDDAVRAHLLALAQRTYVPASAASRASGAGAGLTDND